MFARTLSGHACVIPLVASKTGPRVPPYFRFEDECSRRGGARHWFPGHRAGSQTFPPSDGISEGTGTRYHFRRPAFQGAAKAANLSMQLERILHTQGFGTRRTCRELIRGGRVRVGGETCREPGAEFSTAALEFAVDGEIWRYHEHVYLALNKPAGYECSHRPLHHPSVFSLLPPPLVARGVQCVGRLDEDTTGLLLLTDDGPLLHALSSPKRKVPKVYEVRTRHGVDAAQVALLLGGVLLHDEVAPVRAAACERLGETTLRLTIIEGRYHQVKRMIAAAGNRVEGLRRVAIGGLELASGFKEGTWIWLGDEALARLRG